MKESSQSSHSTGTALQITPCEVRNPSLRPQVLGLASLRTRKELDGIRTVSSVGSLGWQCSGFQDVTEQIETSPMSGRMLRPRKACTVQALFFRVPGCSTRRGEPQCPRRPKLIELRPGGRICGTRTELRSSLGGPGIGISTDSHRPRCNCGSRPVGPLDLCELKSKVKRL